MIYQCQLHYAVQLIYSKTINLKIKNEGNEEREFFPVMSLLIGLLSCFCHSYRFVSLRQSSVPPLSSFLLEGHWLWPREGSFLFILLSFVITLSIFLATFWVSAATFSVFLLILHQTSAAVNVKSNFHSVWMQALKVQFTSCHSLVISGAVGLIKVIFIFYFSGTARLDLCTTAMPNSYTLTILRIFLIILLHFLNLKRI